MFEKEGQKESWLLRQFITGKERHLFIVIRHCDGQIARYEIYDPPKKPYPKRKPGEWNRSIQLGKHLQRRQGDITSVTREALDKKNGKDKEWDTRFMKQWEYDCPETILSEKDDPCQCFYEKEMRKYGAKDFYPAFKVPNGPNSNTFVMLLARKCKLKDFPRLSWELYPGISFGLHKDAKFTDTPSRLRDLGLDYRLSHKGLR